MSSPRFIEYFNERPHCIPHFDALVASKIELLMGFEAELDHREWSERRAVEIYDAALACNSIAELDALTLSITDDIYILIEADRETVERCLGRVRFRFLRLVQGERLNSGVAQLPISRRAAA